MPSRSVKTIYWLIGAPLLAAIAIVAVPALLIAYGARSLGYPWYWARLRLKWPRGKFVLLAYTQSDVWAPYIEGELLPGIAEHCVVVNRSVESWKRDFRTERAALDFCGGQLEYNPIAIVLGPWGRIRMFRFYAPFKDLKHGNPVPLQAMAMELRNLVCVINRA